MGTSNSSAAARGVRHEHAERGRAIHDDVIERRVSGQPACAQDVTQTREMVVAARDLHFRPDQLDIAGNEKEILQSGGQNALGDVFATHQAAVETQPGGRLNAQITRGIGLRIQIDQYLTRWPLAFATPAARFTAVVVLPTPPFWFAMAISFMKRD